MKQKTRFRVLLLLAVSYLAWTWYISEPNYVNGNFKAQELKAFDWVSVPEYGISRYDSTQNQDVETELAKGVKIYPRDFDEDRIGSSFQIADEYFGEIKEIISFDTIVVHPYPEDEDDSPRKGKKGKAKRLDPITIRIETYDSIHRNFRYAAADYGLLI